MKKILSITLAINLILCGSYMFFEPEVMKAATTGLTDVSLTVTGEVSVSCSSTASLAPNIAGQTGGTATSTFTCTTITNNTTGYTLTIKKSQKLMITDAADQRFDDYSTNSTSTDYTWSTVASGAEEFGFSIYNCASSTDVTSRYLNNGTDCNEGGTTLTAWRCWDAIPTTPTTRAVLSRSTATPVAGIAVEFGLQAQASSSNNLTSGSYTTTTTVTVATQ